MRKSGAPKHSGRGLASLGASVTRNVAVAAPSRPLGCPPPHRSARTNRGSGPGRAVRRHRALGHNPADDAAHALHRWPPSASERPTRRDKGLGASRRHKAGCQGDRDRRPYRCHRRGMGAHPRRVVNQAFSGRRLALLARATRPAYCPTTSRKPICTQGAQHNLLGACRRHYEVILCIVST